MLRLIQLLIYGHYHRWTIIDNQVLTAGPGLKGTRYHLQCEKCGEVVKRDLI